MPPSWAQIPDSLLLLPHHIVQHILRHKNRQWRITRHSHRDRVARPRIDFNQLAIMPNAAA